MGSAASSSEEKYAPSADEEAEHVPGGDEDYDVSAAAAAAFLKAIRPVVDELPEDQRDGAEAALWAAAGQIYHDRDDEVAALDAELREARARAVALPNKFACASASTATARVVLVSSRVPDQEDLVAALEKALGVDVAASTDVTGNLRHGGDWTLETDDVDAADTYFDAAALAYAAVDRDAWVDCGAADGELRVVVHARLGDLIHTPGWKSLRASTAAGAHLRNALRVVAGLRARRPERRVRALILSDSPAETVAATLEGLDVGIHVGGARRDGASHLVDGRTVGLENDFDVSFHGAGHPFVALHCMAAADLLLWPETCGNPWPAVPKTGHPKPGHRRLKPTATMKRCSHMALFARELSLRGVPRGLPVPLDATAVDAGVEELLGSGFPAEPLDATAVDGNSGRSAPARALPRRPGQSTNHLERLDAWLTNVSAPPPAHWRVRSPDDLDNRTDHVLSHSGYKDVWLSRLRDGRRVVVKTLHHEGAFEFGDRASDIAYFELLFLEGLRGEPGIPKLFGAYETPTHVVWVTSNGGGPVATGKR
ncbi:hypothetical protein JL722_10756 [Aureococcus anophagefferens]|nr:hypothetical protein JL722_10756 [Aureococcus anophagefferens]